MDTNEGLYHAKPQIRGKMAHESIDNKTASNQNDVLLSLPVYSTKYKLMGKIDLYRKKEKLLIERKYKLKQIFQGQIYQLWAQYFCMLFGFDIYIGVYHRLWFKRKSLICDLVEPFRCIIDHTVRSAYNRKQFSKIDFQNNKGEYRLKPEKNAEYTKVFFDSL